MGKSAANKKNPETAKDVSGGGGKSGKTYRRSASTAVDEDMEIFISLAIEHKEEGNKLFQKRDLEGAMLRYGKSVNLLPKNHIDVAYLRTSIACCYMQMGLDLYPNAISECDLALEASPRYSKALLTRSQCYEALDKLDYAFWDARTVLNMEPKNASGNVIFERVKKRLVDKGVDVDKMEKNFVNVKENRVKKNRGKDDGVKSNRAVVESPKVEMVDEAKSKYKPNEEKSLEPEIDGKMGGDREVKEEGFKNDQGQNKESGNMAGEERKLEDTVAVMDNELITSEIVEGGQSTKEEATVEVELVHGDEVKEEGFKNDQGQNKESGNMAGEERKLEDTVAVMDNELITSEIVEGGQSTKEEATVEVELVHGDEVKEEGFKNDQGQNKESGNMAGEERKLEDTVVVMDNELITSEIVEGGQSTKEEATVAVELVHGDEVRRTELHDGTEVEACCPICYEDVPQPETFTVFGCFHRFCYACMRLYLTSTLELRKPLICPTYGCKTEIETVDCNVFASPAQIAMMIQRKAEESIEVSDRVYCPNPQCSFLMSARGLAVLDAALPGARKCLQCGLRFCINCNMEWHRKMTCGQFQKTMAYKKSGTAVFDAAARKLGWQKCRKCHCTVELAHGCKRMTCLFCKYEFCYSCGKEWTKKHEC